MHKNERLGDFLSAGLQKDKTGNKYTFNTEEFSEYMIRAGKNAEEKHAHNAKNGINSSSLSLVCS